MSKPLPPKYSVFASTASHIELLAWVLHFLTSPRLWNRILASKGVLLSLTPVPSFYLVLLIGLNYKLNSLTSPPFYKIQSFIFSNLTCGITFLARAVGFPSPYDADVGENRLRDQPKECLCLRLGKELGLLFYVTIVRFRFFFLSSTILKLLLYAQPVVRVF